MTRVRSQGSTIITLHVHLGVLDRSDLGAVPYLEPTQYGFGNLLLLYFVTDLIHIQQ